jgi:hypothetical protein
MGERSVHCSTVLCRKMAGFSLLRVSVLCLLGASLTVAQTSNPNCPRNWSYNDKSNKCLQVFGFGSDGVFPLTWSKAEEYCTRFNGGHLASFDTEEEITFVVSKFEVHIVPFQ